MTEKRGDVLCWLVLESEALCHGIRWNDRDVVQELVEDLNLAHAEASKHGVG